MFAASLFYSAILIFRYSTALPKLSYHAEHSEGLIPSRCSLFQLHATDVQHYLVLVKHFASVFLLIPVAFRLKPLQLRLAVHSPFAAKQDKNNTFSFFTGVLCVKHKNSRHTLNKSVVSFCNKHFDVQEALKD